MSGTFYNITPTQQYASTLDILSQAHSKLMPHIWNRGNLTGENVYFNQLSPHEMTFGRDRYAPTEFIEPEYERRRITPQIANSAIPLDNKDLVKTLVDPKSDLARNGVYAAGRAKDKIIWNALYGTAYAGKSGETSTAFSTDQIIDVQVGGSSSDTGLNLDKLTAAVKLLENQNIDLEDPMNKPVLVISPDQKEDLINMQKFTSSDYINGSPVSSGKLPPILGIEVVLSTMVPYMNTAETGANVEYTGGNVAWSRGGSAIDVDSTSHRAVTLFCKSALGFGTWANTQVRADQRTDLNMLWQLWMELQCGAARLEEIKVVAIECQQ
jgi:hypothetical protein